MKTIWKVLIVVLCQVVSSQTNRPHIITILVDDLGWNDVGFHGSDQIPTPNIDALAFSGMVLQRHYVLPTCTPSRSALLTGSYPIRSGMQGYPLKNGEIRNLPLSMKIKPAYLKDLGYRTHMVGKWHQGFETFDHLPNRRGFDSFFGYYGGYIDYYNYTLKQELRWREPVGDTSSETFVGYDLHYNHDTFRVEPGTYATKLFDERVQEVIREHDPNQPLYLFMSHLATHTGHDEVVGMEFPPDIDVNKTYAHIKHYPRRAFAGCLEELDRSVGNLMEALSKKNMLHNAIVLFMSDNGAHTVSVDMSPNWGSNWPLAGTKFTMFEGGIRGSAVIWSPLLPKGVANNNFIHIADWLPTLYTAAGGDVTDLGDIDGIDQWAALKRNSTVKRDHLLINIDERVGAEGLILNNKWKMIKGGFKDYANYDLHWGEEENVKPNPEYNLDGIIHSKTGNVVETLPDYKNILTKDSITSMRLQLKVNCPKQTRRLSTEDGYVRKSNDRRCKDFCLFDIIGDPCEMNEIHEKDIIEKGKMILEEYKRKLVPQGDSFVDPASNPEFFGGVWMPWKIPNQATSFADEFGGQYRHIALVLTVIWYSPMRLLYL